MNNENKENMVESEEIKNKLLEISEDIKGLKFKTRLVGGVDTLDVWRKLSQIDKGYQEAMRCQKNYYEEDLKIKEKRIQELEIELENLKKNRKVEGS